MLDFFSARFQTIKNYFSVQTFSLDGFEKIFSWDFWTEASIGKSSSYTVLVLLIVSIIILGLMLWRLSLKKKQLETPIYDWELNQTINIIIFAVVVSVSYLFFRSQGLAYLSSRLVVLLSFIFTELWITWIIVRLRTKTEAARVAYLEKERFSRYIPKKKKERK